MFFNKKSGFTLVELLVCIAVIAVISMWALPSFNALMARQELKNTQIKILQAIRVARYQAITYKAHIMICSSQDMQACQNNQWNSGFVIFVNTNKNKQIDNNETIIHRERLNLKYGNLKWTGFGNPTGLTFHSNLGLPISSNGTFLYCSTAQQAHQQIIISKMAQTRITTPSNC